MDKTTISYFGATDVGMIRDHNEDTFILIDLTDVSGRDFGLVAMVADGMGGANAGEVASDIACRVVEDRYLKLQQMPDNHRDVEKYLKNLILEAHYQILEHAKLHPECQGMGTTAVIAWIIEDHLHLAWCGDSRAYVYQKQQHSSLSPLTDDHSFVWEMVKRGELTPEEARVHPQSNIILQVLGSTDSKPSPSYLSKPLEKGETIMLCSDGLNGMLSDTHIQQILEKETEAEACTNVLIEAAKQAGGTDNITVILGEVKSVGKGKVTKKGGSHLLKSRWFIFLGLAILLTILLIVIITSWRENAAALLDEHEQEHFESDANQQVTEAGLPQKLSTATEKSKTNVTSQAAKVTNNTSAVSSEAFDFYAELQKLNNTFEHKVITGKQLLDGCESCNHDADLESFNSVIASTEVYLKNQLDLAKEREQVTAGARRQLLEISESLNIMYDQRKIFSDTREEQKYMVALLENIVLKISEEMDKFTTKVEEKK
ncbi:PP2C family protein-serine/threonine phosphatase [Catalinimonas niigatensis]|uniref:PP2C family protein-serine/threonine phosphatase n=1 Tax=Catalinimonas niigatensis TaxID=1397264 RepID=UPI0026662D41|nr:PP2C family serine/threonine-protein phosphatase [Catalinimonas niigatensis]WPP49134.1 PP2C family serine/threonine-protein phosphatase [Catalinimonas niigatensis]